MFYSLKNLRESLFSTLNLRKPFFEIIVTAIKFKNSLTSASLKEKKNGRIPRNAEMLFILSSAILIMIIHSFKQDEKKLINKPNK